MLVGAIFGWWNVYLITVSFVILPFLPSSIPCWPPGIQWMMMRCWCPGAKATSAPQNNWNTQCAPTHHHCHQSSSSALLGLTRALYAAPFPLLVQKSCCGENEFGIWPKHCMGRTSQGSFYMPNSKSCLFAPRKSMFAINTIKDNFFLQILLPRGVWIETNSNLLRTSKSWPSKFMKSNQHFILQTWKLCELHELCQLPWVA